MNLILLSLCLLSASDPDTWPQFLGPDGQSSYSGAPLATEWSATENVVWRTPIPGSGHSSPVVWGNRVWLTTAKDDGRRLAVLALDRITGQIVHDVTLLDRKAEAVPFTHEMNTHATPTATTDGERVFVHFGSSLTAALDFVTAEVLWTRTDFRCDHWRGPGSSPILHDGRLYLTFDGYDLQYMVCLDAASGATVWKTDRSIDYPTDNGDMRKAFSTPTVARIAGREQLVTVTSYGVIAYDLATGAELWKQPFGNSFSGTSRPLVHGDTVFASTGFAATRLLAVEVRETETGFATEVGWEEKKGAPSKPSPVFAAPQVSQSAAGSPIAMVSDQGILTMLDPADGAAYGQVRLPGDYSATPLAVISGTDTYLYCPNMDGTTAVAKYDGQLNVVAENELPDRIMASPAAAAGVLYLRTEKELFAIRASGGENAR